jgi:predicted membrane-bound mannosyltransferase
MARNDMSMTIEVAGMTDQVSGHGNGRLDRPVFAGTRITVEVICVAIVIFNRADTLMGPGLPAYCHDESIHAGTSWKLATGQGYIHDPVYHGPFLYHLTALVMLRSAIAT